MATTPPPEEKPAEPVKVDPPVQTPVVENTENLKIPKARQVREGWGGVESLEGKGRMNGETSVCVCVCVCVLALSLAIITLIHTHTHTHTHQTAGFRVKDIRACVGNSSPDTSRASKCPAHCSPASRSDRSLQGGFCQIFLHGSQVHPTSPQAGQHRPSCCARQNPGCVAIFYHFKVSLSLHLPISQ